MSHPGNATPIRPPGPGPRPTSPTGPAIQPPYPQAYAGFVDAVRQRLKPLLLSKMVRVLTKAIQHTPPFVSPGKTDTGGFAKGKDTGMKSIQRDVSKVFKTVQSVPFSQLVAAGDWQAMAAYNFKFTEPNLEKAFIRKDIDTLRKAFVEKFGVQPPESPYIQKPAAPFHKSLRGKDGLMKKNIKGYLVDNKRDIQDYARTLEPYIGRMVNGWYEAATQLGLQMPKTPFPGSGSGKGTIVDSGTIDLEVVAENLLGNFGGMLVKNMDCEAVMREIGAEMQQEAVQIVQEEYQKLANATATQAAAPKTPIKPPPPISRKP